MRLSLIALACLVAAPALGQERVVVAGSALAEIVAALGASDRLVGRDSTVSYPEALTALPDVGYMRALSAEGLLSLGPDLILADTDAGPQATLDLVAATDVPVVRVNGGYTAEGVIDRIETVAQAMQLDPAPLVGQVQSRFAALAEARETAAPVSAIFVLSAAGGRILASGQGTAADGILHLAGAQNAITGFEGYRQLTDEAIIAAAPQAIVMMDRSGDHALGDADILAHPALGLPPAAQARRIVRLDGAFLLGFGPRTPDAARALMDALED